MRTPIVNSCQDHLRSKSEIHSSRAVLAFPKDLQIHHRTLLLFPVHMRLVFVVLHLFVRLNMPRKDSDALIKLELESTMTELGPRHRPCLTGFDNVIRGCWGYARSLVR